MSAIPQPLVSIVMPNFNKGQFLGQTIESVLAQTRDDWELIIVDDRSTDDSALVAQRYVAQDPRISFELLADGKQGGSCCRNQGWKKAKGEYVIFFDSDDLMIPEFLEHRVSTIETGMDFYAYHMGIFVEQIGDRNQPWRVQPADHLRLFLQHKLSWGVMSVMWPKTTLEGLKGFDEDFPRLQDVELSTRALLIPNVQYKVVNDDVVDCYYRVGERHSVGQDQFMTDWVAGAVLYVDKIRPLVDAKDQYLLKGTIMATLQAVIHRKRQGAISRETYSTLWQKTISSEGANHILTGFNRFVLKLYRFGADMGLTAIKGYNFVMTKVVVGR